MNDNPEIRAKILEWQRRHNIQDNDPALALIDLLDIYYRQPGAGGDMRLGQASLSPEAVAEAVRQAVQPAVDRLVAQVREATAGGVAVPANAEVLALAVRQALQPEIEKTLGKWHDAPGSPASAESLSDAIRISLLPTLDRLTLQFQELQKKIVPTDGEEALKKIETYHENIDFCTKKLEVVKKESETLIVKIEKVGSEIKPITRGAVMMLMLVSGVIGYVLAVILR